MREQILILPHLYSPCLSNCKLIGLYLCICFSGSILIEKVPGDQLLDVPHQLTHQVESTLGSNQNFGSEVPLNTLAQLQRQVDKLNSQASGRPQPHRPIETLYQSIQLPPTFLRPMHPPQQSHRTILPPSRHISPISSPTSSGLMPKVSGTSQVCEFVCLIGCLTYKSPYKH